MATRRNPLPFIVAGVVGVVLIIVIRLISSGGDTQNTAGPSTITPAGSSAAATSVTPRPGCVPISIAASSEKAALMGQIAVAYSRSGRTTADGKCYDVSVRPVASGRAEQALANDWNPDTYGPQPDVWTPAASTWIGLLRNDLTTKDKPTDIVPAESESVTSTPLVLAMPQPMAQAMGWPTTALGWSDVLGMIQAKDGWASRGHQEWGKFTLGKTNPNSSTSGLAATIGSLVAATGKSSDLTENDLKNPKVRAYAEAVEKSVIHYGDTTLTYLSNLQRADDAGAALNYVSAVAVEEKSVLDYNAGNPSGDPKTLGQHKPPRTPLVAVYPKEGTLYSDSPYVILNAGWNTPEKQAGAKDFLDYLRAPEQQKVFTNANFRTYDGKAGDPITHSGGTVQADGVKIVLVPPGSKVLSGVRALWSELRKPARVLLVLDVSGSMGQDAGSNGDTRLDLAKKAALSGLDQLAATDQVGLWVFTSDLNRPSGFYDQKVPIGPLKSTKDQIKAAIQTLQPLDATPLYAATRAAVDFMNGSPDPDAINAVVVMTDGKNEYPPDSDLNGLIKQLTNSGQENGVRVFTIAYGEDADLGTLQKISEATRAAAYDARKPESIIKVFADVLSNF